MAIKTEQSIIILECKHPIDVTVGKTYEVYRDNNDMFEDGGEKYIIDDKGQENYSVWMLCKVNEMNMTYS
ncbi:hypothetical protein QYF50_23445 [Paenibacillus vini]|uniref:hypothetical protein n=1 Tax=Paenibacillus vini TaxID=1476024 RepID=UPI0025B6BFB9|nr:hypothetical protein [Paenibacillus vini]MDN4070864.1 hypothetical protein [Paenibacillus vini]